MVCRRSTDELAARAAPRVAVASAADADAAARRRGGFHVVLAGRCAAEAQGLEPEPPTSRRRHATDLASRS